jgi:GTP cyclohydrolase I
MKMLDESQVDAPWSAPAERDVAAPPQPTRREAEEAVRTLIRWAGDNPSREGLRDTPARVVHAYREWFAGYCEDPDALLQRTFDEVGGYSEAVLLRDIPVQSTCEHHMAAIRGVAHIAYLPNGRVVGISKLARLVDALSRRLQIQERLTAEIAAALERALKPRGVAVVIEAQHECMSSRGVRKHGARLVTCSFSGIYRSDPGRAEAMDLLAMGGRREPLGCSGHQID